MLKTNSLPSAPIHLFYSFGITAIFFIGLISPRLLAYLPALMGLSFFLYPKLLNKEIFKFDKIVIGFFACIIGLAFISCLWSPDQSFSIERSIKITLILSFSILFMGLSHHLHFPNNTVLLKALIAIHLIGSLFFVSELQNAYPITKYFLGEDGNISTAKYNRSHIVFAFLTLTILFLTPRNNFNKKSKIIIYGLITISACALFFVSHSQTAQLTFLAGLFFMFIFPTQNKIALKALIAVIMAFIILFPLSVNSMKNMMPDETFEAGLFKKAHIIPRLDVWNHSVEKTMESPIYGHGIEALRFLKSNEYMKKHRASFVLHSHNSVLQIWIEFGVFGIVLGLIFMGYFLKKIYGIDDPIKKRFCLTIFMSCFICSLTGYGLWQSWQIGLFIFMAGLSVALTNPYQSQTSIKTSAIKTNSVPMTS